MRQETKEKESTETPREWRTQSGEVVQDSDDIHTLKFVALYRAVDPERGNYEPARSKHGHMTFKGGRGEDASYKDYHRGDVIGVVELPEGFSDKSGKDVVRSPGSSPMTKEYYRLEVGSHSPSEHAENFFGCLDSTNKRLFRINAKLSIRVRLSTEQLTEFYRRLGEIEKSAVYFVYGEIDRIEDRPTARCLTPLKVLAEILDRGFEFNPNTPNSCGYIEQFAQRFPEITSESSCKAYSGAGPSDGEMRRRVDPGAITSKHPVIDVGQGSR